MKTKQRFVRWFVTLGVFLAVILIAVFSAGRGRADATKAVITPVAVEVTPAVRSTITESVSAVGTVAAMRDVMVSSETAGRITSVLVEVGDVVRQGQTMVRVDNELKAIAVDQARAQLLAAQTNYSRARNDYDRAQKLRVNGDIADIELEGVTTAYHAAEAQMKVAEVGLRYAQRQLEDANIKSPIAGRVASKRVEVGEMVSPGHEVANVVDVSSVKVKLSIPEEDIIKIRPKQPVSLRVDSRPSEAFMGKVYTIGSKSESPTGHSYPVEVVVQNRDLNVLRVGMFARVDIQVGKAIDALAISKESLVGEIASPGVYVVEDNLARFRAVKLGILSGQTYEVRDGLREGDRVITFGQTNVKDGSPVQFK